MAPSPPSGCWQRNELENLSIHSAIVLTFVVQLWVFSGPSLVIPLHLCYHCPCPSFAKELNLMGLAATFTAPQCTVSVVASSKHKNKRTPNKRAGVSTRAQRHPKSEEEASIIFSTPALSNGSASVIEATETKAPSPSIHIISPVSQ